MDDNAKINTEFYQSRISKFPEEIKVLPAETLIEIVENFTFGFDLVETQANVVDAVANPIFKEVVLIAGRSWGKDLLLGQILYDLCYNNPKFRVLFVTPFFSQIESFFDQVFEGINDDTGISFIPHGDEHFEPWTINRSKKEIQFWNGSVIVCRSAENPNAIRSKRANLIVVNEAAFIPEDIIQRQILAVIKKGQKSKIIWVSTPEGKNWLYNKYVSGCSNPNDEDYDLTRVKSNIASFRYTYEDNPLSALDVDSMRENLTTRQFEQEVLAKFLDDSSVFTNLGKAVYNIEFTEKDSVNSWGIPPVKERVENNVKIAGHNYVAGWDIARVNDWSVLTIIDINTGKIVRFERFSKMDAVTQCMNVLRICEEYNSAYLIFDMTGLGGGFSDVLVEYNKNPNQSVDGRNFSPDFKANIINSLALRIERDEAWIANIPQLLSELRSLQVKRTDLGKPKYEAPTGRNDDCVMSLALANYAYKNHLETFEFISINI